ncbi:uncharacterized protein [Euphorbia lathyris]|uniref:uncharacterized protein n=1 Tax=Euphorbia lathyris TaxID=212925 RepID=UPI0033134B65
METQPITQLLSTPVVSCSLKRKRPPQILIPNVLQEIQADKLQFSGLNPQNEPFCFSGIGVGVSSTKGKKKFMEDAHKIVSCLNGSSNNGFFGVYDGHGGHKAAEFVAENLHTNIVEMMVNCSETGSVSKVEAVKAGYLKTDQQFLKQGVVSGACCVTALIEGQEVVVSNLGDCRAVLCRGGVAEALTKDHRAEREDERERIENKGGYVEIHRGSWRVHGVLSVTRSVGDAHLKDWVVAEPDTVILQLTPDTDFLVLASDGLWEEVGNQEAVDTVIRCCMPEKKSGSTDVQKDDSVHYGCVNVSPSSKLKRVSLVKQKGLKHSPSDNKTIGSRKDMQDDFPSENESPPSKLRRISLVNRINIKADSPINGKYVHKQIIPTPTGLVHMQEDFPSENESPPSKLRRFSLVNRINIKADSPINGKNVHKKIIPTFTGLVHMQDDFPSENESPPSKSRRISLFNRINTKADTSINEESVHNSTKLVDTQDDFPSENESPASKSRRISLFNRINIKADSPINKKSVHNSTELVDTQDDFPSENESPPLKSRRISLFNRINIKADSPINQKSVHKKKPASTRLVAACKELVNLAVSRGSLDDITVMIIDLNHFRCLPACFSSNERQTNCPAATITRSGQSVFMSIYRTKLAGQCRLITIKWCKNVLLHGLSISVQAASGKEQCHCKVELKPWYFWRKQGCKQFETDGRIVDVFWDLKAAKFNGETEPKSDYYLAIVCEGEVVLLNGDMKKEAYKKTRCRPALIEPILVSKREHIFGKRKFSTKIKLDNEKEKLHEISIECNNSIMSNQSIIIGGSCGFDPQLEIKVDGELAIQVKHLQWKFRGNEAIAVNKTRVQVFWDVHDWLFGAGPRHGLFIFNPVSSSSKSMPLLSNDHEVPYANVEDDNVGGSSTFCLFLYTWKVE